MRIMLDAHFLDKKKEGNRTFVLSLIAGLDALCSETDDFSFFLATYNPDYWRQRFPSANLRWVSCSRNAWRRYLLDFPRLIRRHDIQLIQHTYHLPVWGIPAKVAKVVVVHDILPLTNPRQFSHAFRWRFTLMLRRSLRRADRVVCGSRFTRDALVREMGVEPSRIRVIPYGVRIPVQSPEITSVSREATALYVGRLDRRKNLDKLLDIIEAVNERMSVTLVVAGRRENVSAAVMTRLHRLSRLGMVRYLGQVADEALENLFHSSGVLLYFPEAEGFGYPVLEAMAHGLPYLTAGSGAIAESAAEENLVDPDDTQGVARKVERILTDPEYRSGLVKDGLQRVRLRSVEVMAREFIQLYGEMG